MKKMALFLAVSSIISTSAFADFYAGLKAGPSFNVGKAPSTKNRNAQTANAKLPGAGIAALAGGVLGYDQTFTNNFYVGIEGSVLKHSLNNTALAMDIEKHTLQNKAMYGADLHIGYKMENDIIPFVSLGVTAGRFKVSYFQADNLPTASKAKTILGFTPGLGLKYSMCDKWMITSHYQYFMGKKISASQTTQASPSSSLYLSQQIRQHHVTLGLAYKL